MPAVISAERAILRFRRDLTISTLLKGLLLGAALLAVVAGPLSGSRFDGRILLFVIGAIWLTLSFRSIRGSRLAADSPSLIAAGQYDLAERQIVDALHSFSLFKTVKLLSLHHLAVLRHAQSRWQDAAMLARTLLGQKLTSRSGLSRSSRLILADALLELNDLPGAFDSLASLYSQRLSLPEALNLLRIQVDYESRLGAWPAMMAGITHKVELAELLPTDAAGRTQALLALAAKRLGREDWSGWLRRRAGLLVDPRDLIDQRPILNELWADAH